jgi:endonuclease YncB( thermonuclease family)
VSCWQWGSPSAARARAEDLTGRASVIDGDTIEIRGHRIRLFGIDAPRLDKPAPWAAGSFGAGSRPRSRYPTSSGRRQ